MSTELKSFPPSEEKKGELRRQGIIPYSEHLMSFAIVLGLCLSIFLLTQNQTLKNYFLSSYTEYISSGHRVELAFEMLLKFSLYALVPILFFLLLFGFLQTRFLVSFSILNLNIKRIFSKKYSNYKFSRVLYRLVFGLLVLTVWVFIVYLLFSSSMNYLNGSFLELETVLNQPATMLKPLLRVGSTFIFAAILFCALIGFIDRLLSVKFFNNEHSMSRRELEAEIKDNE